MPESFVGDDLSYRVGTHLFTHKQTAVRRVYQLNNGDRCVCEPQTQRRVILIFIPDLP